MQLKPIGSLVTPFLDTRERELFATPAPARPNPIGISAVRLIRVRGCTLDLADVDILDGAPLLDIKPYVAEFDAFSVRRSGWLGRSPVRRRVADTRFIAPSEQLHRRSAGMQS
jgi:tRNA (Thr-GGU) A37 N-methylase